MLTEALSGISIHALREEGDAVEPSGLVESQISIHALREEGDPWAFRALPRLSQFLSTPSARRATGALPVELCTQNISIHALREEGDPQTQPSRAWASRISIHALREEGDLPVE